MAFNLHPFLLEYTELGVFFVLLQNKKTFSSDLPDWIPMTSSTGSGSGEVGQPFNLSCSVTLVERMVVSPGSDYNITWMKMDSQGEIGKHINIPTLTEVGDPTTTVTLAFDMLRFEDRGEYICIAEFNLTTTNDAKDGFDEYDIITASELETLLRGIFTNFKCVLTGGVSSLSHSSGKDDEIETSSQLRNIPNKHSCGAQNWAFFLLFPAFHTNITTCMPIMILVHY